MAGVASNSSPEHFFATVRRLAEWQEMLADSRRVEK